MLFNVSEDPLVYETDVGAIKLPPVVCNVKTFPVVTVPPIVAVVFPFKVEPSVIVSVAPILLEAE
jgi:hypothetical protein